MKLWSDVVLSAGFNTVMELVHITMKKVTEKLVT